MTQEGHKPRTWYSSTFVTHTDVPINTWEKSKINERKEDAPGSIALQVIERKWEPGCALCACVFTSCAQFVVTLKTRRLHCTRVLRMWQSFLVGCHGYTGIDSCSSPLQEVFFRRTGALCHGRAFKSINKATSGETAATQKTPGEIHTHRQQRLMFGAKAEKKKKIRFSHSKKWNTCLINHFNH